MQIPSATKIREFQAPSVEKVLARVAETFLSGITEDTQFIECQIKNETESIIADTISVLQEKYGYQVEYIAGPHKGDPETIKGYLKLTWGNQ